MSCGSYQEIQFTAYEAITLQVTMSPSQSISGWTTQLNIRQNGVIVLQSSPGDITDATDGIFTFNLSSTQTGSTMGAGTYQYDIWRTDSGFETMLVYGTIVVFQDQWQ